MNQLDNRQILDHLSVGTVVLNSRLEILFWNRWMSEHSGISLEDARGKVIHVLFQGLIKKDFVKKAREVFRLGNPVFFTNKVHQTMFPFYAGRSYLQKKLKPMQQTVILSPVKDDDGKVSQLLLTVFDITDWIDYRDRLVESKDELEKLSQTDELTQLPNRRSLMEKIGQEIFHHNRRKRAMGLAMIDLDHFKGVNDQYGHQVGDQALFELARTISDSCRNYDVVGRYGGEEFVVMLPDSRKEQAIATCERIRQRVESTRFCRMEEELHLTISIGLACKEEEEKAVLEELFHRADAALYLATGKGRNRVEADCDPNPATSD